MSKMNLQKLRKDFLAFTISRIASKTISYFLLPLYTSVMVSEEFGFADTIITLVNLFYPIFTLAIYEAVLRFAIEKKTKKERGAIISIACVIIIISSIVVKSIGLIVVLFQPKLFNYWNFVIMLYILINLELILTYFAKAVGKTKLVAITGVVVTSITIVSNVMTLVVFKMGLNGYLISLCISYLICIIFIIIAGKLWKEISLTTFTFAQMSELIKYSTPMIITIIAWWINTTADKYILEYSVSLSARGIYAAAYKIPSIISTMTAVFINAWKLTLYDSTDEETRELVNTIYKYLSLSCCFLIIFLGIFSELICKIMLTEEYRISWSTIPILAGAVYYSTMSGYLASIITKQKKTYKLLIGTLSGAVINIIMGLIFIPIWGIRAAAATTMIGFMITWFIRICQINRIVPLKIKNIEITNTICIITICVSYALEWTCRYYISIITIVAFVGLNIATLRMIFSRIIKMIGNIKNKYINCNL